jgi:hypothetical protein
MSFCGNIPSIANNDDKFGVQNVVAFNTSREVDHAFTLVVPISKS